MNKLLRLLMLSFVISAVSFDTICAWRTGQTRKEQKATHLNALKQAKRLQEVSKPIPFHVTPSLDLSSKKNQFMFFLLTTGLILQSVNGATYDGKLKPIAQEVERTCDMAERQFNITIGPQGETFSLRSLDSTLSKSQDKELYAWWQQLNSPNW